MISLLGRLRFFSFFFKPTYYYILREENLLSNLWEGSGVSGTWCCLEGICYVFCNTRTQCAFSFSGFFPIFFYFDKTFFLAHIREVGNTFVFFNSLGGTKSSHHVDGEYVCMRVCANTINEISSSVRFDSFNCVSRGRNKATLGE